MKKHEWVNFMYLFQIENKIHTLIINKTKQKKKEKKKENNDLKKKKII